MVTGGDIEHVRHDFRRQHLRKDKRLTAPRAGPVEPLDADKIRIAAEIDGTQSCVEIVHFQTQHLGAIDQIQGLGHGVDA